MPPQACALTHVHTHAHADTLTPHPSIYTFTCGTRDIYYPGKKVVLLQKGENKFLFPQELAGGKKHHFSLASHLSSPRQNETSRGVREIWLNEQTEMSRCQPFVFFLKKKKKKGVMALYNSHFPTLSPAPDLSRDKSTWSVAKQNNTTHTHGVSCAPHAYKLTLPKLKDVGFFF